MQSLAARSRRGRGHRQPGRRTGPADHRADHQLVSELLPRCVTGRALPGARHRPVRPRPRNAAAALRVSRVRPPPCSSDKPAAQLAQLRAQIDGRFWLHLGEGWRFFAPENYITRLTAVLDAEPQVFQVGINFADAVKLTGACAAEQTIRRAPDTGRYLLTEAMARGPAMFDTARLDRAVSDRDPTGRPTTAGLRTASLDEVLCISGLNPRSTWLRPATSYAEKTQVSVRFRGRKTGSGSAEVRYKVDRFTNW